ncbi:MAG: DUF4421 family protein [Myxococcota bacterium]
MMWSVIAALCVAQVSSAPGESPKDSAPGNPATENAGPTEGAGSESPRRVVRLNAGADFLSLSVESKVSEGLVLDYQPNSRLVLGALLGYGPFTLFAWTNGGTLDDDVAFGSTRAFDIAGAYTLDLNGHELNLFGEFRRYRGFYLANTGDIFIGASNERPIVRGDISSTAMTFSGTYFFDRDFSYADAFYDAKPDRTSRGSWVARLTTGFLGFGAAAPIVPPELSSEFGRSAFLSESNALLIAGSGGYVYDWVRANGFYLTGMMLGGGNVGYRISTEGEDDGPTASFSASVALALGWSNDTYSIGLTGEGILDGVGFQDLTVGLSRINVNTFFQLQL